MDYNKFSSLYMVTFPDIFVNADVVNAQSEPFNHLRLVCSW